MRRILPLFLVIAFLPTTASALTLQEVVTLTKAGVSEAVMLAMIDRDNTIFAIDANQLVALKRDGVSEKITIALLKSGRQEPPPAPAPSPSVTSFVPNEPTLVMVGHGPERPNTYHNFDSLDFVGSPFSVYPPAGSFLYQTPYAVGVSAAPWMRTQPPCTTGHRVAPGARRPAEPVNCRRSR